MLLFTYLVFLYKSQTKYRPEEIELKRIESKQNDTTREPWQKAVGFILIWRCVSVCMWRLDELLDVEK